MRGVSSLSGFRWRKPLKDLLHRENSNGFPVRIVLNFQFINKEEHSLRKNANYPLIILDFTR